MLNFTWTVEDALTDADSVKFSDPTGAYGLRRVDTHEIRVADGVNWVHVSDGTYRYDESALSLAEDAVYDYWIEVFYDGEYTRLQRFITGDGSGLPSRVLRFVTVKDGEYFELDGVPTLTAPAGLFGVKDLDGGVVALPSATEFVNVNKLYTVSFPSTDNHEYAYYVKAIVDDVVYYLPRTTLGVMSSNLLIGRYTDSVKIEGMYGVDNVRSWMSQPSTGIDEPIDYAIRQWEFLRSAEDEIDAELVGAFFSGDGLDGDFAEVVPPRITQLATMLAGVLMYEAMGVTDYDSTNNRVQHKFRWQRERVYETLKKIRNGVLKITGGQQITVIPSAYVSNPVCRVLGGGDVDPFSILID